MTGSTGSLGPVLVRGLPQIGEETVEGLAEGFGVGRVEPCGADAFVVAFRGLVVGGLPAPAHEGRADRGLPPGRVRSGAAGGQRPGRGHVLDHPLDHGEDRRARGGGRVRRIALQDALDEPEHRVLFFIDVVVGVLLHRMGMTGEPMVDADVDALVEMVLPQFADSPVTT